MKTHGFYYGTSYYTEIVAENAKNNFSENYQNLIKIYADMHNNGTIWDDAESTFDGKSLKYFFSPIKQIIDLTKSQSLIDFGCGKAKYYFENVKIDKKPRSKIKPSDHTPIELEIS